LMLILAVFLRQIMVVVAFQSHDKYHLSFKRTVDLVVVSPFLNKLPLNGKINDNLDSLKLDESKISNSEKERLAFIQKLTLEADDIVRTAGFSLGDEENDSKEDVEKSIRDTQWSGQSEMEEFKASSNSFQDVISRPFLALGDVTALVIFASIGRSNHGEGLDIGSALSTAFPFIVGWLAVSPFLGSYSRAATASQSQIAIGLAPGWLLGISSGLVIRGALKGDFPPPTPFIAVSLTATFVLLYLWRSLYIAAFGETSDGEYRKAGFLEIFKMVGTLLKRW